MRIAAPTRSLFLSFWKLPVGLALLIAGLDQGTKHLVVEHWPLGSQMIVVPGFFNLVHFRNTGAAWGMFEDNSRLLAVLSALILGALIFGFNHLAEQRPERGMALGLIAGGILGNLGDRLFREQGGVVDFLLFHYRGFQWPAFNVADSAITCGVALFILSTFLYANDSKHQRLS